MLMNNSKDLRPKRIKPIDIDVYKLGKCFLCGNDCDMYMHYECAIAYERHRSMLQTNENRLSGN